MSGWLLAIELVERGGEPQVVKVPTERRDGRDVVSIGRVEGNGVVIARGNVSKRHCELIVGPVGDVVIVDGSSTNGTWVNGKKLTSPAPFGLEDQLYLGDHVVRLVEQPQPRAGWRVTLAITQRGGNERMITSECQHVADDRHELTIGRHADIALDGDNVSRVHCALIVNDAGATWIADRGSSNGTYLDGERVPGTARFAVGQRLHVGNFVLRLVAPPVPPPGHVVG